MKLSAQVRLAPGDSVAERIACLAAAGYEAVELHSDAVDRAAEYRNALEAAGIPAMSMCPVGRGLTSFRSADASIRPDVRSTPATNLASPR